MQGAANEIQNPAERIQFKLENHFQRKKPESGYESVMQYVIEDSDLSAAQIEQLRKAVEAGMPAEDILEMAQNRKDVMEIRRCIEFYEMMQQKTGKQENVKKKQEGEQMSEELQSLVQIIELYGRGLEGLGKGYPLFSEREQQKGADRTGESIATSDETSLCQ